MFIVLFAILLLLIYLYGSRNHDYWKKRNVKHDPPIFLFGNNFECQFGKKSLCQKVVELCQKYPDEKLIGYYRGSIPELIVNDAELAKHFLSLDFAHFHYRGFGKNTDFEPLALNLFQVEGDKWKLLRQRLTPAFTTAKLKGMFPLVVRCAEKLKSVVENEIIKCGEECDVRSLMARFTTEFTGACGFGIEMDTINNEKSLFTQLGRKMFILSFSQVMRIQLYDLIPHIRKYLNAGNKEVDDIMFDIVTKICEQRNYKPSGRNDFIDLLLHLQGSGKLKGESIEKFDKDGKPLLVDEEFDFRAFVAQAFLFFAAGFETSSSSTSYTLHQLAFHPDVQVKVQEEIDRVIAKYDNKLCYDAVAEMNYLYMTFKEALRMMPPLGILNRECTKTYKIPGTDITIDPGVKVIVANQALHMSDKYYDNPEQFRPERFAQGEPRHKFAFIPFGEGPRNCIGLRLGEMQSMAGLAVFLHNFTVEPSVSTKRVPVIEPKSQVQSIKGGLPLKIKPRKA